MLRMTARPAVSCLQRTAFPLSRASPHLCSFLLGGAPLAVHGSLTPALAARPSRGVGGSCAPRRALCATSAARAIGPPGFPASIVAAEASTLLEDDEATQTTGGCGATTLDCLEETTEAPLQSLSPGSGEASSSGQLAAEPERSVGARRQGPAARAKGKGARARRFPQKGHEYELVCDSLAFKGLGVCKIEGTGLVVLCERALPGERLIGRIYSIKKNSFAQAFKVRTLAPHANAVEAPCPHFPACGGCRLQNLSYEGQLAAKEQQVGDVVARLGRFGPSVEGGPSGQYMRPIVACEQEYYYRNKMEFSFGSRVWIPGPGGGGSTPPVPSGQDPDLQGKPGASNPGGWALGLHAPRRFDKVLPIDACLLQDPAANEVLRTVREHCEERRAEIPPHDVVTHEGFLRHLTIRKGRDLATGGVQLMVNIATKDDRPGALKPLAAVLAQRHPEVVSVINSVHPSVGDASPSVREHVLHGEETITAALRGLTFRISATSFFQTNTEQAEILYGLVERACGLRGDGSEVVLDLFCGTGTIGLSLASKVRHVYGFELVPEAVADARSNAARNGVRNATFVQGDLGKLGADFGTGLPRPDVVITDPNRPGMHPKLLQFLLACGAPRIVYVSCNPATCARDLDALCHTEGGGQGVYRLVSVQPVDMFPQTPHVECISVLEQVAAQPGGISNGS